MRSRALWWVAALLLGLVFTASRVSAQRLEFEFLEPEGAPRANGSYTIRWKDDYPQGIFNGCLYSITWYYATKPDGSDKRRMSTILRDDFSAFRQNWELAGAALDWDVKTDPQDRRRYLRAPDQAAGPAISKDALPVDAVVSALVRPRGLSPEFSVGLRVGERGRPGFEIRHVKGAVQIVQGETVLASKPFFELAPSYWYWYEFGVMTKRNRDAELRVRIFDEKRQRVLVDFGQIKTGGLRGPAARGGLMAITGPADYAEVYVDRWPARWADDLKNEFEWGCSQVPNGRYYIIAEISDGKKRTITRTSSFQVQVANSEQALRE